MSSHATANVTEPQAMRHPKARSTPLLWLGLPIGASVVAYLIYSSLTGHGGGHGGEHHMPHLWGIGILPFIGILGSIAFLPLIPATQHWWERNLHRLGVSLLCAGLTCVYLVWQEGLLGMRTALEHAIVLEYIPFIVLLFSLYVISGGVCLRGDLAATPGTNTAFLAVGACIASFIGTTGASMVLIRPLLQTNAQRRRVVHTVVFFILLVSNIGGTLLPIGDPPLFLGYLEGVPFFWTMKALWLPWAVTCGVLLAMYYAWDRVAYRKEAPEAIRTDVTHRRPLRLQGWFNVLLLGGIVACVAFVDPKKPFLGTSWTPFPFLRELIMLGLVGVSLLRTPAGVREFNRFDYHAILEVAALFVGIFIAMQVPLQVLEAAGPRITETLNQPWQFFWLTGGLSSFLDNAPTYLVFFRLGQTMPVEGAASVHLGHGDISAALLVAISLGAVFMGAMTYIGNGPNFMVKSIAEQAGIRMPSFFGYLLRYTVPILVPVFIVVTLLFLVSFAPGG